MYKRLYFIGIIAYIILFAFSLVFYKERTIFLDAAFNVFYIIKDGFFKIQIYRFGDVFTQLFPLIATKGGTSLNTILTVYSSGFIIFYFGAYVICGSILKRYDFSIVILLLNLLFVADTFFWMISQLPQAIAIFIVILAMIDGKQFRDRQLVLWIITALAEAIVVFYHPLVVFVLLYAVLFFMLRRKQGDNYSLYAALVVVYFVGLAVKVLFFKTPYEGSALSGMKNFITQFPDYFTLYSDKLFLRNCLVKYYWIPVLFIGITFLYSRTRQWRKLSLFAVSFLGYLMLVNISYPTSATPVFYIENLYLPLSIFLALPFVFDMLPLLDRKHLALPVIVLIIVTGCARLYATHYSYTAQLNYERNILDKYGEQKVILDAKKSHSDTLAMLWGTPYEFLLLSESERNKPASIIIDEHPEQMFWAADIRDGLRVNWTTIPYKELPARYFNFKDTSSGYTIIK